MFKLAGDTPEAAAAEAKTVMSIQKRFASAAKAPVELRDSEANYNKKSLAELAQMTPNFSWTEYLKDRGVPSVKEVNVGQPKFFEELSKMMTEVPISEPSPPQAKALMLHAFVAEAFTDAGDREALEEAAFAALETLL